MKSGFNQYALCIYGIIGTYGTNSNATCATNATCAKCKTGILENE